MQSVLRALEEDGLLHTLAEPNLTAISGETANFLAGGEFPIPVAQQLGTISVEFKKFGIGLAFTPVVMTEGRISLKVSTEVSELTNQGAVILSNITIPALKVRRAETVVELPSGGSLVMAGLLSDQSKQALSGYPGLKNLPVLGALFRSRDYLKNETELVGLVTPYIVKSVDRQQLAQPDHGFGWASDVNTDLLGQMNRIYGRNPERAPVGKFDGDVGFVVEIGGWRVSTMAALMRSSRLLARPGRFCPRVLAIVLIAAPAGGCIRAPRFQTPFTLANPNERHPIPVRQGEVSARSCRLSRSAGLTRVQRAEGPRLPAGLSKAKGPSAL